MKKHLWLTFFVVVLVTHLIGALLNNKSIQFISKPLIVLTLTVYFIIATKGYGKGLGIWILLALLFSWVGDILLLFENDRIFFLLGVFSFLVAHVFYIVYYNRVRLREGIRINVIFIVLLVFYCTSLLSFFFPYLGEMKLPVSIYSVVIGIMSMLALHMLALKNKRAGMLMLIGPLLFIISDFVLAVNKFYMPIEQSRFIIMLTYAIAQLFIVEGANRYITSDPKQ